MSRFTEYAEQILSAAESAATHGEASPEMTILIGQEGGIHMLADCDWPLESLAVHHGARAAYRVSQRCGEVRVEGCESGRTCVLTTQPVGRRLQSSRLLTY